MTPINANSPFATLGPTPLARPRMSPTRASTVPPPNAGTCDAMPDAPGQPLAELWSRLVAALRKQAEHDPALAKRADRIQDEVLDGFGAQAKPPLLWFS